MSRIYSKLFRKRATDIKIGGIYITDDEQIIKIVSFYDGGSCYIDTNTCAWSNGGEYIPFHFSGGRKDYTKLYHLNEKDKKKYWPEIIKDDF